MKVEFFKHCIDKADIENVTHILNSIFLTNSHVTEQFEQEFSLYLDVPYCVGVNSGTAALHLALLALGIGEGDEVITTPMSFVATTNAILYTGAVPVFVDVERNSGNLDADKIEEKLTKRTKAILPVHLYGNMVDMIKIREIADKNALKIVEDSAHCIEGQRDNIRPGQLSDAACFSFYATKNITSGEGGAIVCHDLTLKNKLMTLRHHGISKDANRLYQEGFQHRDMTLLGYKSNMSDIQAGLLIGQLKRIKDNQNKRKIIADYYFKKFDKTQIGVVSPSIGTQPARHLFPIFVPNRDRIINKLNNKHGIGVAIHYTPIHLNSYYMNSLGFQKGDFPIAEEIGQKEISIPIYPRLTEEEYRYVSSKVIETVEENCKA